jgi:hypothetical protein
MAAKPDFRALVRAILLAFAVSTIIACEDPFTNGAPAASPGVVVPGIADLCPVDFDSFGCMAWSADSKTLYIGAGVGTKSVPSLIAVDPATLASRVVGPIDATTFVLEPSADGTAIYFTAADPEPSGMPSVGAFIRRMSLIDGSVTTIATTRNPNILVSPDGTALAYHAANTTNFGTDTIVMLDLRSGTRRATTIEIGFNILTAFSADGTELSIVPSAPAVHIWHLATGMRDTILDRRANSGCCNVAWSGGAFHILTSSLDAPTFTDTSLAGGSSVTYTAARDPNQFQWQPDRSAMLTVSPSTICRPQDCSKHWDFDYVTATNVVTVGAASYGLLPYVSASPDGHWVAHTEGSGPLYLLHRITP